jgi:hypothetical protein
VVRATGSARRSSRRTAEMGQLVGDAVMAYFGYPRARSDAGARSSRPRDRLGAGSRRAPRVRRSCRGCDRRSSSALRGAGRLLPRPASQPRQGKRSPGRRAHPRRVCRQYRTRQGGRLEQTRRLAGGMLNTLILAGTSSRASVRSRPGKSSARARSAAAFTPCAHRPRCARRPPG